ncbi:MAG TPA: carboxypeptidase-like regulatory domain-containing protein, partial [Candidatus Acidoferrales bacterium]|nr:carboxypeptidase-like regulatory domain-containing protein [Candidatus Acidoferrales bacterium]
MNLRKILWRYMSSTFRSQALLLLTTLGLGTTVHAQTAASISGTITDATGGPLVGSSVTVKDLETGALRTATADEAGRYVVASLEVGVYEVRAEKTSFKAEVRTGITLAIGQHAEVNLTLQVGSTQESVVVSEDAPVVNVTTQDISGLIGERQVKELPLNGRSYDQLLTLNPGVVNYTSQRAGGTATNNSVVGNMFAASGRRPQENLYILNGVEFTSASEVNNTPGGVSGQLLGVDAVREFAVVKDTYGAEYGKRPGAQVNIVTASGTNQLHGNVYEFLRNSALDARNFFDQANIPRFQRNVFGGSLGGPIKKDKTFLFGNYEGFRQTLGLSDVTLVPDDNARNGLITPLGSGCPAAQQAACSAEVTALLTLWPIANGPEVLTTTGGQSGIAEALSSPLQHIREDFGTARFDQIFSDKDSFAGVYTADDGAANTPTANPLNLVRVFLREQVASLSETNSFSSRLVNKATFGFSRGAFYYTGESLVSLPGFVQGRPVGALAVGGSTAANANSQISLAGTNATSNLTAAHNLFTATDQGSLTRGKHLLNFGVWLQRVQVNDDLAQNQYGLVTFGNLQTFLQGTVKAFTTIPSPTPLAWRSLEGAAYVEDAIKLKPSLELRLGFRGESTNGWNEAYGRASNYQFDSNGVIQSQPAVGDSALTVNNARFLPAPRVGIAWSPFASKKTVIRAGYGLYYALLDNLSYRLDNLAPYNASLIIQNVPITSITGSNAIVPGAPLPPGAKVPPSGVQQDIKTPAVNSWSLKVQQQVSPSTSLSVGYTGSHGYHGILTADYNVPVPTICPASPCPAGYPAGTRYNPPNAPLANPTVGATTTWASGGVSSYHGLEVDLNRRFSHGLQLRGVYTFSKALDDGDTLATTVATNSPAYVANPLQPKSDYGRASFDIRHAGVINATYDLPFARR